MADPVPPSFRRARRLVWTLIALFLLVWAVGTNWDQRYHVTNLFDTFWSPPHLFIYSGYLLVALIYLVALFWMRDIHPHLGPPLRVPPLAFPVPAPFLLIGLGFVLTGMAGLIDSKYHEALGLRETHWSLPHVMLGASGLLTVLGFAAALVALRKSGTNGNLGERSEPKFPFRYRAETILVFWGLFAFATGAALGPLFQVAVPQLYQALLDNRVPGIELAIGDDLRWNLATSLAHGLTRAHPAAAPAAVFIAATLLATLRALVPRRWSGVGWALFYTLFALWDMAVAVAAWRLYDRPEPAPAHVLPFPLLPMAVVVGLLERSGAGRWPYAVAGGLAGAVWGGGPGLALGAVAALAGREAGRGLRRLLVEPTRRDVAVAFLLLGVALPVVLGGIDIALRTGKYWWIV